MVFMPRVIAICGYKRCGKDTLANHVCEMYDYEHVKISGKLKQMMNILFGFSTEQLEGPEKEVIDNKWGISPRKAMQFFGTEIMQFEIQKELPHIQRTFWIKSLIEEHIVSNPQKKFVISDVRFLHEYKELQKYGLLVVKIKRGNMNANDCHISETEFETIPHDIDIDNSTSIKDMYKSFDDKFDNFIKNQNKQT